MQGIIKASKEQHHGGSLTDKLILLASMSRHFKEEDSVIKSEIGSYVSGVGEDLWRAKKQKSPQDFVIEELNLQPIICREVNNRSYNKKDNEFAKFAKSALPEYPRNEMSSSGIALAIANGYLIRKDTSEGMFYLVVSDRLYPGVKSVEEKIAKSAVGKYQSINKDSLWAIAVRNKLVMDESKNTAIPNLLLAKRKDVNKPTLVLFSSQTCSQCNTEFQEIKKTASIADKVNLIVVGLGEWTIPIQEKYGTFALSKTEGQSLAEFVDRLQITSVPTTLLLNKTGNIEKRFDGKPNIEILQQTVAHSK